MALTGGLAQQNESLNGVEAAGFFPHHIAIIMDGNGRWAALRGLPRTEGHRRGVEAVRRCVEAAIALNIRYLTLFSFSSENWQRPEDEVSELMGLLKLFVKSDLKKLHQNNVKIRIIGEPTHLKSDVLSLLQEAEKLTENNQGLVLVVAFNYGARQEIVQAAFRLAQKVAKGQIKPEAIDIAAFERELSTYGVPDPDVIIRTSGEQRMSNFLLWQAAYSELVFVPELWPDFDRATLEKSIAEYQKRERRFGGLGK